MTSLRSNEWKPVRSLNGVNYVLRAEGFGISYNPCTSGMFTFFAGDGNGEETALVEIGPPTRYYILNGDFREDYARLVPEGLAACKRFFAEHASAKSSWSNDLPEPTTEGDGK